MGTTQHIEHYAGATNYARAKCFDFYNETLDNIEEWWKHFSVEHQLDGEVCPIGNSKNVGKLTYENHTIFFREKGKDYRQFDFHDWLRYPNPTYPTIEKVGEYILETFRPKTNINNKEK